MPTDVRMRGFASRTTVEAALAWLDTRLSPLPPERARIDQCSGRVLAQNIVATLDVPGFDRSMMDGFAVRADETLGASAYNPLELTIVGASLPGRPFAGDVQAGQAVRIMTGAPLPAAANAVLPAEVADAAGDLLRVLGEVSPGKHIGRRGEDIAAGVTVLSAGRCLRPQDLGVLASLGITEVAVVCRPRVRIVVTGNELLTPGESHKPHKIYDANGPMLRALVARDGGVPLDDGPVADRPEAILATLRLSGDVLLVSGGSSVGEEDHAPSLVAQHGELPIHGIAMRPSSPTGLGVLDGRPVFLLPGNPVSCLCAYDFFAGRAIRALGGLSKAWPYPSMRLPLRRKLTSSVGRLDYARVRIVDGQIEPLAIGGASLLTSTTRADGFVVVPADSEGYAVGAEVEVFRYDTQPAII